MSKIKLYFKLPIKISGTRLIQSGHRWEYRLQNGASYDSSYWNLRSFDDSGRAEHRPRPPKSLRRRRALGFRRRWGGRARCGFALAGPSPSNACSTGISLNPLMFLPASAAAAECCPGLQKRSEWERHRPVLALERRDFESYTKRASLREICLVVVDLVGVSVVVSFVLRVDGSDRAYSARNW